MLDVLLPLNLILGQALHRIVLFGSLHLYQLYAAEATFAEALLYFKVAEFDFLLFLLLLLLHTYPPSALGPWVYEFVHLSALLWRAKGQP